MRGCTGKPTTRGYSPVEKEQTVRLVRTLRADLGTEQALCNGLPGGSATGPSQSPVVPLRWQATALGYMVIGSFPWAVGSTRVQSISVTVVSQRVGNGLRNHESVNSHVRAIACLRKWAAG